MNLSAAIVEVFEFLEIRYSPKWTTGNGNKTALIAAFSQNDIPKHTFLGYKGSDGLRHAFGRAIENHNKPKNMLWETWLLLNINKFQCYSCKEVKDLSDKVTSTVTKNYCRQCDTTKSMNRRSNIQNLILEILRDSNGCVDCGESDPVCLEFDHTDPSTKEFNIGDSYSKAEDKVLREIQKCEIVCANCHRKRTAQTYKHYKITEDYP